MHSAAIPARCAEVVVSYALFHTPIGVAGLAFSDAGVLALALPSQTETATEKALIAAATARRAGVPERVQPEEAPPWVRGALARIAAHLGGRAADLEGIPLDEVKLTAFRRAVYRAARAVPRGSTITYGELAERAGHHHAARAVGRAMATNPLPLLVPCHRVLDSRGSLHGFSSPGGVRTKALLLSLEADARVSKPTRRTTQGSFDF